MIVVYTDHPTMSTIIEVNKKQTKATNILFGNNILKELKVDLKFEHKPLSTYLGLITNRNPLLKEHKDWDDKIILEDGSDKVAVKYVIKDKKCMGSFKGVSNIESFSSKVWKFVSSELTREKFTWIIGYMNSGSAYCQMKQHGKLLQRGDIKFSIKRLLTIKVPDFDYYRTNHPERFEKYLNWVEKNMHDKEKFLEGIDRKFGELVR